MTNWRTTAMLAVLIAAGTLGQTAWAQNDLTDDDPGDQTIDASDIGAPAAPDDQDMADDDEAGDTMTSAPDSTAPDTDTDSNSDTAAADDGSANNDRTSTTQAPSETLPEPSGSDYGAGDFKAPDDQQLDAAAARQTQAAADSEHDASLPDNDRNDTDGLRDEDDTKMSTATEHAPSASGTRTDNADTELPKPDDYGAP